ncbi:MAG: TetR/AcrR family transcriptional regulator [Gammaproteobacteria bacterium]
MSQANPKIKSPNTRDQVMASALRLFTGNGYFNTSIPDIVRDSGVSTGSIYHHFGDKEGVAKALFDTLVGWMEEALQQIENKNSSARDRCRDIIQLLFQIAEEEPDMMKFMLHARHKEFLPQEGPICSSRPFLHMREMVAEGITRGEIQPMDDTVAAAAVFGGALRMIQLRLDGILEKPLTEYQDDIWTTAWRSVAV